MKRYLRIALNVSIGIFIGLYFGIAFASKLNNDSYLAYKAENLSRGYLHLRDYTLLSDGDVEAVKESLLVNFQEKVEAANSVDYKELPSDYYWPFSAEKSDIKILERLAKNLEQSDLCYQESVDIELGNRWNYIKECKGKY